MRIIKLTSVDKSAIYINVEHIGHFYEVETKMEYGRLKEEKHTRVGVATHNNGGFKVIESVEKIIKLIDACKGI
jgi:hypothetical protein